jgi:hypothetical protein
LPEFLDYDKWFVLFVHRQQSNAHAFVDPSDYYRVWKAFFDQALVCVAKLTHQCRRQAMQELDDAGEETSKIARISSSYGVLRTLVRAGPKL